MDHILYDSNYRVARIPSCRLFILGFGLRGEPAQACAVLRPVPLDVPLSLQSTLHDDGGTVRGAIQNTGSNPLDEVLIVRGGSFDQIGTLPAGASQTIMLDTTRSNFPQAANLADIGPFHRQELLKALFTSNPIAAGNANSLSIDSQNVYMLAWSSQPTLPVQVNGQRLPQRAITLYIIRLRS